MDFGQKNAKIINYPRSLHISGFWYSGRKNLIWKFIRPQLIVVVHATSCRIVATWVVSCAPQRSSKTREVFGKDCSKNCTLTFDMRKTQPLPHLQTNKVFYLRQLWFYNLGIHHTAEKQGYMFCWVEGAAKRGSREIGSRLLKFVQQNCSTWDELVLWSDSCGVDKIVTVTSCVFCCLSSTTIHFSWKKSLTDLCGVVIHTFPMIVISVT